MKYLFLGPLNKKRVFSKTVSVRSSVKIMEFRQKIMRLSHRSIATYFYTMNLLHQSLSVLFGYTLHVISKLPS